METLTIQDQRAISQFKSFLFDRKEEFIKGFRESGQVYITLELIKEVIHLQDYFGHVIFNEFKVSLINIISNDDLEKFKVDYEDFKIDSEHISNPKMIISLVE